MLNLPLFDKVLDKIKTEPESWDQEHWAISNSCGTAFCFAGHVANLTMGEKDQILWAHGEDRDSASVLTVNGEPMLIGEFARRQLGIDGYYAEMLFKGNNTLTDIEKIREKMIKSYGLETV